MGKVFGLIKELEVYNFDEKSARITADILRKLKKEGRILEIRYIFIA